MKDPMNLKDTEVDVQPCWVHDQHGMLMACWCLMWTQRILTPFPDCRFERFKEKYKEIH